MAANKHQQVRRKSKTRRMTRTMQMKLMLSFAAIIIVLVILFLRIAQIDAENGSSYARQVLSQRSYDSQTIPARRGEIRDRNGIVLAKSDRYYRVFLDCLAINSKDEYLDPTVSALHEIFSLSESDLRERITGEKTRTSQYQVILKDATDEQKSAWEDYVNITEEEQAEIKKKQGQKALDALLKERSCIVGVYFEATYKRSYPYGDLASKVIGFSNDIDQGTAGIESYYDSLLNGTDGRVFGYLNDSSEFERTTIEPEHGNTLDLTLDMNIQEIVQEKINAFDETYGDDDHNGKGAKNVAVIAMDPNSGEVLAMATNSEYDLNKPYDLSDLYTDNEVKEMSQDTYVNALAEKWNNFCVSVGIEPGSVVKPITVASALECGAVTDGDGFYCDGGEFITDTYIKCDNIYGHGAETLEDAIKNSCNDALMQIGMKMGISNFLHFQKAFFIGRATGIDLPNENPGAVYSRDSMHEVELATNTFGQGFTLNMVQEISAFCAVVNGGYYYQPHVLKQVLRADGRTEKTVEPLMLAEPVSSQVSSLVRKYIHTAVREGTGKKSRVPGYATGGKTGTAEKIDPNTGRRDKGKYLVSFIGAAPIDDPKIVIYVVVDEPNVADQADSSYAQTLFREIATEVYPYMGLFPTEEIDPNMLAELGLTTDDIVENHVKSSTFQCFGSDGVLHNDAYINSDMQVVDSDGNVIPGCTVDVQAGTVTDGYGNVIEVEITEADSLSANTKAVDNPDIANPPSASAGGDSGSSTWSGVTDEDLKSNLAGL